MGALEKVSVLRREGLEIGLELRWADRRIPGKGKEPERSRRAYGKQGAELCVGSGWDERGGAEGGGQCFHSPILITSFPTVIIVITITVTMPLTAHALNGSKVPFEAFCTNPSVFTLCGEEQTEAQNS